MVCSLNYLRFLICLILFEKGCHTVTLPFQFLMHGKFDILEASNAKKNVMSSMAAKWRQFKSSLTTRYAYAENQGEDNQAASKKYGMDPETREQFEASNTTPTDVAPSRAYSPCNIFILFIFG